MDLPFELFIAVRYLLARRKQAFISLISLISVLGVAVGVMALLIALSLMTGLQGELRDRLVGPTAPHYWVKGGGAPGHPGRDRRRPGAARAGDDSELDAGRADPGQGRPAGTRTDGDQRRQVD